MIFIKNFAKDLSSDKVKLELVTTNDVSNLNLLIEGEETIKLVESSVQGVNASMKKSIDYIGRLTNCEENTVGDTTTTTVNILDNKTSEVAFFVKGAKTVIKESSSLPNIIDKFEESDSSDKHYPRDVIAMIIPHNIEHFGYTEKFFLTVDRRNLGARTVTVNLKEYTVILMYVKWPIWSKLKFPAYAYIKAVFTENDAAKETIISAFKLGSITNRKIQRNQLVDVPVAEAKDYLDESFKILREKSKERQSSNTERNNKRRTYNNNRDGKSNNKLSSRPFQKISYR